MVELTTGAIAFLRLNGTPESAVTAPRRPKHRLFDARRSSRVWYTRARYTTTGNPVLFLEGRVYLHVAPSTNYPTVLAPIQVVSDA